MNAVREHWGNLTEKVDSMSLRERALIFAAAAFLLVMLLKSIFLDPLLLEQKKLSAKIGEQQATMSELQAKVDSSLQARSEVEKSPLHRRLEEVRRQLAEGDAYMQSRRDRLVEPDKMPELLEQVLNDDGRLQLVSLQTLPVTPLIEKVVVASAEKNSGPAVLDKQVYKHGVVLVVRGRYLDLQQYLAEIEQLPTQMFWGKVDMKVEHYPDVMLTLTLYTLSLDETWLQI